MVDGSFTHHDYDIIFRTNAKAAGCSLLRPHFMRARSSNEGIDSTLLADNGSFSRTCRVSTIVLADSNIAINYSRLLHSLDEITPECFKKQWYHQKKAHPKSCISLIVQGSTLFSVSKVDSSAHSFACLSNSNSS